MIYAVVCMFLSMRESLHAYMCVQLPLLTSTVQSISPHPPLQHYRPRHP